MSSRKVQFGIIVNLDVDSVDEALSLVTKLAPHVAGFKIGFELVAAMLASVIPVDLCKEAVHAELGKISHLFNLLGCDALQALWFVSKANGDGCNGIVCASHGLTLIGNRGEKISYMTSAGEIAKTKSRGDYCVLVGS
jgi:hypothetical protein